MGPWCKYFNDETVESPAKALDANGDGKITKDEFLANGGEAIFSKPMEGLWAEGYANGRR